jgi:hypothetical protein
MGQTSFPIVGAHYRPPAKTLLGVLSLGTKLTLMAEPENQYDPNAVAVWLNATDIKREAYDLLEEELPAFGFDLAQIIDLENWHLGYIPKAMAAKLREVGAVTPDNPVEVTFSLSPTGEPRVRFEVAPY